MGRKKKKHIIFYDKELGDKIDDIKESEGITYDELLKRYLKLPETDDLFRRKYEEIQELLRLKYKNDDITEIMDLFWVLIMKSAHGEYDTVKLKNTILLDIEKKTYKKR